MTRSLYVIGGAGVGKSTFTAQVIGDRVFGPKEVIHDSLMGESRRPNPMHGQRLSGGGLYLGVNRDEFPGSDGLSRTCGTSGAGWLRTAEELPRFIISEGTTLATRTFQTALHERTELLLVHLKGSPGLVHLRLVKRGSSQTDSFVRGTATRAATLAAYMRDAGARVLTLDAGDPSEWSLGLDLAQTWIK